jgi:hypothetical protein
LARLEKNQAIS